MYMRFSSKAPNILYHNHCSKQGGGKLALKNTYILGSIPGIARFHLNEHRVGGHPYDPHHMIHFGDRGLPFLDIRLRDELSMRKGTHLETSSEGKVAHLFSPR